MSLTMEDLDNIPLSDQEITTFVNTAVKDAKMRLGAAGLLILAERNEMYLVNRGTANRGDPFKPWPQSAMATMAGDITIQNNKLSGAYLTVLARLKAQMPSVTAYPVHLTPSHLVNSKTANTLIDYIRETNELDEKNNDVLEAGLIGGTGGYKIAFDDAKQEIVLHPITIHDFYIDDVADVDDARWVIFRQFIDEDQAKEMLKRTDGSIAGDPVAENYTVSGVPHTGVELLELWHLPTGIGKFRRGIWAQVVGGHVVARHIVGQCKQYDENNEPILDEEGNHSTAPCSYKSWDDVKEAQAQEICVEAVEEYPYSFIDKTPQGKEVTVSMLPIALWQAFKQRGTVYGHTPLSDAVDDQIRLNSIDSTMTTLADAFKGWKIITPENVYKAMQAQAYNQIVPLPAPPTFDTQEFPLPKMPPMLAAQRNLCEPAMYDKLGVSQQLAGARDVGASTSAKKLAFMQELDSMKQGKMLSSLARMMRRTMRMCLLLAQRYFDDQTISYLTEEGEVVTVEFRAADLIGMGVRLRKSSPLDNTPEANIAQVEEDAAANRVPQAQVLESRMTGSATTISEERQRRLIRSYIADAQMSDEPLVIDEDVHPIIAIEELQKYIDLVMESEAFQTDDTGALQGVIAKLQDLQQQYQEKQAADEAQMQALATQKQGMPQ